VDGGRVGEEEHRVLGPGPGAAPAEGAEVPDNVDDLADALAAGGVVRAQKVGDLGIGGGGFAHGRPEGSDPGADVDDQAG
jgi:hypothetical protein